MRRRSYSERQAMRERWALLSPWKKMLLMSERPNELERLEYYERRTMRALEWRYGDRQWDATVAVLAEGEAEEVDRMTPADAAPDGMTLDEIGAALAEEQGDWVGPSRERIRQIIKRAMGKLRQDPIMRELYFGSSRVESTGVIVDEVAIDAAIKRALEVA